jgi:hypothetical protein
VPDVVGRKSKSSNTPAARNSRTMPKMYLLTG